MVCSEHVLLSWQVMQAIDLGDVKRDADAIQAMFSLEPMDRECVFEYLKMLESQS